jgi:hypothetical protein
LKFYSTFDLMDRRNLNNLIYCYTQKHNLVQLSDGVERVIIMQQWEYLFLDYAYDDTKQGWYPKSISEVEIDHELRNMKESEAANFLGKLGWEMVSYAPIVQTHIKTRIMVLESITLVFKRPKQSISTSPVEYSKRVY